MKKRTKNRIADVREKRARFASGLARTARSARLRFCLFRRFVFIQGVCLSRRAQRADLFKTSIRLSAKGVCVMIVKDKHMPQSQHGSKGGVLGLLNEILYNF